VIASSSYPLLRRPRHAGAVHRRENRHTQGRI
jgi:hypothetical protein